MDKTLKAIIAAILIITVSLLTITFSVKHSVKVRAELKNKDIGLNPIVRLTRNGRTYCSGFVIDSQTIVTAAHCAVVETPFGAILNDEPIEIRAKDNVPRGTFGKVKGALAQIDRAVIKGDFRIFSPMRYMSDVSESVRVRVKGTKLIACGYPLGGDYYCGPLVYIQDFGFMMAVEGVLIPGMSGGPTMLENGVAIGINDAVTESFSIIGPLYNIEDQK